MFPVRNLSRGNTQPENMCDIVFEKTKGLGGTMNFIKRETSTQVFPCETTLFCRISAIGRFLNTKARRPSSLLERCFTTGISLRILRNFQESFFGEHLLGTTPDMMLFFFLFAGQWD